MVWVAMPPGVCNEIEMPPLARLTEAFTEPFALLAAAAVALLLDPPARLAGEASKSISAWFVPRLPLPATWVICEMPLTLTFCPPLALALRLAPLPPLMVGPVTEAVELNWTFGWLDVFVPMASEPEATAVAPFGNCHCDSRV